MRRGLCGLLGLAGALPACLGGNVLVYNVTAPSPPPGSARIEAPPPLLDRPAPTAPTSLSPESHLRPRALLLSAGPTAAITQDALGLGLDAGFLYDGSPNGAFKRDASRDLWGFGAGLGGRLLSWGDGAGPRVGTTFAEARFGALELGSRREFGNGWGSVGVGWAWDPSRRVHGPSESLCMNNYCVRMSHLLGQGTEFQLTATVPALGLHFWSD